MYQFHFKVLVGETKERDFNSPSLYQFAYSCKTVSIIVMDLDNYFNILFTSRTEVLTFGRKLNGKRKSMGVELKHHDIS